MLKVRDPLSIANYANRIIYICKGSILNNDSYNSVLREIMHYFLANRLERILKKYPHSLENEPSGMVEDFQKRLDYPPIIIKEFTPMILAHFLKISPKKIDKEELELNNRTQFPINDMAKIIRKEWKPLDIKISVHSVRKCFDERLKLFIDQALINKYDTFFRLMKKLNEELDIEYKESDLVETEVQYFNILRLYVTAKFSVRYSKDLVEKIFCEFFKFHKHDYSVGCKNKDLSTISFLVSVFGGTDNLKSIIHQEHSDTDIVKQVKNGPTLEQYNYSNITNYINKKFYYFMEKFRQIGFIRDTDNAINENIIILKAKEEGKIDKNVQQKNVRISSEEGKLDKKAKQKILEPLSKNTDDSVKQGKENIKSAKDEKSYKDSKAKYSFKKRGDYWEITFDYKTINKNHIIGFSYLYLLVHKPNTFFPYRLLAQIDKKTPPGELDKFVDEKYRIDSIIDFSDDDKETEKRLRKQIKKIEDEKESCLPSQIDKIKKLEDKIEQLKREVARLHSSGTKDPQYEKLRKRVQGNLRRALKKLEEDHSELHDHLKSHIIKDTGLKYHITKNIFWE